MLKKHAQIYLLALFSVFMVSCRGQNQTDLPKDSVNKQQNNLTIQGLHSISSKSIVAPFAPSSITRNIIQDKKENTWLATWNGIIHYDGNSFTNITDAVSSDRFFDLLEDTKGHFWFASIGGGVYYYDGKEFTNFTTNDGLPNNRVTNIYEDKKGNIWFATEGGASRYDGKKFVNFTSNESDKSSLYNGKLFTNFTSKKSITNNDVNSIIEDQNGIFWFGTRGEACFYDGKTFTTFINNEGQPFTNIRSIIEDRNGNIWLGGQGGLWKYDGNSFINFSTDFVGYIYEDKKGNIWTSSDKGYNWILSKYDERFLQNKHEANVTQLKPQRGMLFGISEDEQGNIWFGTLKGAVRYDEISFSYFENPENKN